MKDRHDGMQTPHEGYTQHSIAEATPHQRYAQLLDVDIGIYQEIETASIDAESKERKGYEFVYIPAHEPKPAKREQATSPYTNERPLVESLVGVVGIVHHLFIVYHLEHMLA